MPIGPNAGRPRAIYVDSYRNFGRPLTDDNWRIDFLPTIGDIRGSEVKELVREVDVNYGNLSAEAVAGAGTNTYYATPLSDIQSFSLTFHLTDWKAGIVLDYVRQWKLLVEDERGLRGLPKDYKKQVRISYLTSPSFVLFTYLYEGVWPTETSSLPLTSTSPPSAIEFKQDFSVDAGRYAMLNNVVTTVPPSRFDFGPPERDPIPVVTARLRFPE